ncbi:DnaJ-class molecular chaperone [Algoriphagus sp. 4150]|uniref:tetratricopeptide repeat protein n=1 Tax=Algoriphagus sp. 4150 TaxID=2817756 RepID=UPI00285A363B|nr:molecular chaperone DnaJ [Algoriphagus sp. 4150]MDR7130246.1 DnaJ-class molecular chaperone [Algoriphagus sp. 4150]
MNSRFHPPIFLFILFLTAAFGQVSLAQIGPNLGQTDNRMKGAKAAIERNDYETANSIFRNLIDSGQPLPEEMPYLFAETLFELKQYDNSANFLSKYLELTGFAGSHYKGAQELQERLKNPLKEIQQCQLCDRRGYRFKTCFTCEGKRQIEQDCNYCKAKGVVGCSRCSGSGMITRMNIFNIVEYFECDRCEGKGRLDCPVCKGSLKEVSSCQTCNGSGKLSSETICDHEGEHHDHS